MRHLKTIYILLAILFAYSCTQNRIEIGNIERRSQLDSIMALLPNDSITIDSLTEARLHITLSGNLSLMGQDIRSANFNLKNEELISMGVNAPVFNFITVLNHLEEVYGLGTYKSSKFEWELDSKLISLVYNNSEWSWGDVNDDLSRLDNNTQGDLSFEYNRVDYYRVSELAKFKIPNNNFDYYLQFDNMPDSREYTLSVNGIKLLDNEDDDESCYRISKIAKDRLINHTLPKSGLQMISLQLTNGNSDGKDRYRSNDQPITLKVIKRDRIKLQYSEVAQFQVKLDKAFINKKQEFQFQIADLPYTLDYVQGVDLRTVANIKEQMIAKYQTLKEAYESENEKEVIDLLFSADKLNTIAYNYGQAQFESSQLQREAIVTENMGLTLADSKDLDIEFAYDGKLARLVNKKYTSQSGRSPMTAYLEDEIGQVYLNYYFYMDKDNTLNFILE